ncbi:MAG: Ig-like domain-containing protein, partial [Verrucomicrobia bacterium]|nr:Ig-like domain-containing protein [Verrucomicrobiota bacterium]MDA1067600.1 Ig-like domain-containing protein [Verrucomicrobiota bacterium]
TAFDSFSNLSRRVLKPELRTKKRKPSFRKAFRTGSIYNGIGYVADHTAGLHVVNYLAFDSLGQPPTVTIVEPEDGASIEEGSLFLVRVDVQDDVQVRNVEFYVDDQLIKTDGNFPFEVTLPAGSLDVTNSIEVIARASDTGGNASFSDPITLNLTPDSTPPRVNSVLPSQNAIIGDTNGFTLFFSEAIDPNTIDELSAYLIGVGEDGLFNTPDDLLFTGGLFSFSEDGSIISYLLDEVLDSGYFRITVETSVTDNIGNALRQKFVSVFLALGDADTDQDGLSDVIELNVGLDPNDPDSDDDGISDGKEDIDGDGVTNDVEAFLGFNLGEKDSDMDGINDNLEDADMDGLPDFREVLAGTNINLIDSDGDGFSDEAEFISGSSPIDSNAIPFQMVFANPPVNVLALSSNVGVQSPGITLARPPVSVLTLSSNNGDLSSGVTLANPRTSVMLFVSAGLGDLAANVTLARPPVSVLTLSADTGDLPPGVTVAHPPASVMLYSSVSGDLSSGVTLANPPVEVTDPVEP